MVTKICRHCGVEFVGRPNKLYCSNACKTQAFMGATQNKNNNACFVPLHLEGASTNTLSQGIAICYPNGVRILLPADVQLNLVNIRALVNLI